MSSQTTSGRNLNYHGYNQHLTPRTPRSRSGKPVTSFGEDETGPRSSSGDGEALDEVDLLYTQSDPLLRSSASVAFPPEQVTRTPLIRSPRYPKHHDQASSRSRFQHLLQIIPLILGAVGALGLLVLILLSVHRPQILQYYILNNSTYTSAFSPSQKQLESGLDYSNHTSFPLESIEYEEECWSFQNSHETSRGDYWEMKDAEMMDVPHEHAPGEGGICSSTITYILDGSVGLFYDLALIAQAAAFAREVGPETFEDGGRHSVRNGSVIEPLSSTTPNGTAEGGTVHHFTVSVIESLQMDGSLSRRTRDSTRARAKLPSSPTQGACSLSTDSKVALLHL